MKKVFKIREPISHEMEIFEEKFSNLMLTKVPLLNRITLYIIKRKGKLLQRANNMLNMAYIVKLRKRKGNKNMDIFVFIIVLLVIVGVGLKKFKPDTYNNIKNNIKNITKEPF